MGKGFILSDIGLLLGIVGVSIALFPFLSSGNFKMYNVILPLIFGIVGLILVLKIKKELNDQVVKIGLILNPLAIILGIIVGIIYLIK